MRLSACLCAVLALCVADAKRFGGGGGSRGGSRPSSGSRPSGGSRYKPPSQPSRPTTTHGSSNHFLDAERGGSSSGTTHHQGNPFSPSAPHPPKPPSPPQSTGHVGFEQYGNPANQGGHQLGFDRINSGVQNRPGGSNTPHYPANQPQGPPPSYYPGGAGNTGFNEHPPAYPGRPINAPPSYSSNPSHPQTNPHQPGFGNNYNPSYPQTNPHQPGFGNNYNPSYPQTNPHQPGFGNNYNPYQGQSFGNTNHGGGWPQQNQFGNQGFQTFPGSYHNNFGSHPGGGSPYGNSYQGNSFGGSPFGGSSFGGNPYGGTGHNNQFYSPNNFGYSNNPGYFGSGYHGQYEKKSRFGGLPIPIPIPIPIPFGGFGGGGYHNHNHNVLDTFIKGKGVNKALSDSNNASTSVFLLNNSTVTPCTTDHFMYGQMKVTVLSCTMEFCTAIRVAAITNTTVESVHSGTVTMCLDRNLTLSHQGDILSTSVSQVHNETLTVCRNVTANETTTAAPPTTNGTTTASNGTTTTEGMTTDAITTDATTTTTTTTTEATTTTTTATAKNTTVCDTVECFWATMCLPTIEVVDRCNTVDCPFRRTGFTPCVTVRMCRSPAAPVSTFASLNTTISKIDEFNHQQHVHDAANLTLISYHRPVVNFPTSVPTNSTTSPEATTGASTPPK